MLKLVAGKHRLDRGCRRRGTGLETLERRLLLAADLVNPGWAPADISGRGITLRLSEGTWDHPLPELVARILPRFSAYTQTGLTADLADAAGRYTYDSIFFEVDDVLGGRHGLTSATMVLHGRATLTMSFDGKGYGQFHLDGISRSADGSFAIDPLGKPAAASGITASAESYAKVLLGWTLNGISETSVVVKRWNGQAWNSIAELPAGTTTFADTRMGSGRSVLYEVVTRNEQGEAWAANYAMAVVPAVPLPGAPSDLRVSDVKAKSVTIGWAPGSDQTSAQVVRWTGSGWKQVGMVEAGGNSFTDTGLQPATTYYYDVIAVNRAGNTWAAQYVSVDSLAAAAPAAPTDISATATISSVVHVAWTLHGGETSVQVRRWNGHQWEIAATLAAGSAEWDDKGRLPQSTYHYEIVTVNEYGVTWAAAHATLATPAGQAPKGAHLIVPINSVGLMMWVIPAGGEPATGIAVTKFVGGKWVVLATLPPTATEYIDRGLMSGWNYYEVIPYNAYGGALIDPYISLYVN